MYGKQLIQAAVLLALVLFASLYSYIEFFVAPLARERETLLAKISTADTQFATGGSQLKKILAEEEAEKKNEGQDRLLERLMQTIPAVPQVICPTLLSRLLTQHGVTGAKVFVTGFLPLKGIEGGLLQSWAFESPQTKPFAIGEAMADIENQLPMAQITDFQIGRKPAETVVHSECSVQFVTFR